MVSAKREATEEDEAKLVKKAKLQDASSSSEPKPKPKQCVVLNPADCDLDFNIEGNGLRGYALHEQGFAYCWSGARANVGITGGKYCFGCKIISCQPVEMEGTAPEQQHVCRIGISRGDDSVGNLGETEHSFGFGGTGKFSNAGKFSDYGEKFGVGDTIVCAVNLEERPFAAVSFSKNGKWLGIAKKFDAGPRGLGVMDSPVRKRQWESALFPHILLKNVVVELQFNVEGGLVPEEGFKPWASALDDRDTVMGLIFSDIRDCEVIMMVGLPASGKTTWAEKRVKEHPEKRYVLLGTNLILDQMKVPGLLRKQNYGERFDRLMDRATEIFNTLLLRAANKPRNYIIDQTNVFKNARKRKLKPFALFQKIAVVVFPSPEELKFRSNKRFQEMGKEVPADAVNNMLANYTFPTSKDMPSTDEFFDQVIFAELDQIESQKCLDDMKRLLESTLNLKRSLEPRSNFNSRNDSSPYSQGSYTCSYPSYISAPRESPIRPYPMPSQHNQLPLTVGSSNWTSSYSPGLLSEGTKYHMPSQATAHLVRSFPQPDQGNGNQCFSVPKATTSRGNNLDYESSFDLDNSSCYQNYGMGETYSRQNVEGSSSIFGAASDLYRSSIIRPPPVGSARASFPYNAPPPHFSGAGDPRGFQQVPRAPSFCPSPLAPPHGSPYGIQAPRPRYGNFPSSVPYRREKAPRGPRLF